MANLSPQKRQRMLDFLQTIRKEHNDDDNTLIAFCKIIAYRNSKKAIEENTKWLLNYNLLRRGNMYITKIIERFGSSEMVAKSIDELCNEMSKEGYSLVTYQFHPNNEMIFLTFKNSW